MVKKRVGTGDVSVGGSRELKSALSYKPLPSFSPATATCAAYPIFEAYGVTVCTRLAPSAVYVTTRPPGYVIDHKTLTDHRLERIEHWAQEVGPEVGLE